MTPALMPIGIIDESNDSGAIFTMARPGDRNELKPGDSVTVWNFYQDFEALARIRGQISEVSQNTASFIIIESQVDPSWPGHIDPMGAGNPVYLADPDSFQPDITRKLTSPEELEMLNEFAKQHEDATGIKPAGAAFQFSPQRNTDRDNHQYRQG